MVLLWILVGFIAVTALVNVGIAAKEKNYFYSKKLAPPPWADENTRLLFKQFNNAWSSEIEKTVNLHVKKAQRTLKQNELRERWYELKKYLFLAGLSKGLPMFSEKVDDIWHFFLEEEALYNDFCHQFIGERIEHHPHETPKHLPAERAWFDILYLSFFNITSHSNLWGKFVQDKDEQTKWAARLANNQQEILNTLGRHSSESASVNTLSAFLKFARELLVAEGVRDNRVKRDDGYWYGSAMLGMYGFTAFDDEKKDRETSADGSIGYAGDYKGEDEWNSDWNEFVSDVNTFHAGTEGSSTSNSSSDGGGSDSGSSCSSCSGCSS